MRRHDSHSASPIWRRASWLAGLLAATLVATLLAGAWPALSTAAQTVTELKTSGPLTTVDVSSDLGCQIQASGDASASYWGVTGTPDSGSCGTWLALTAGTGGSAQLYGPTVPTGPVANADFTATAGNQTLAGAGTSASPFTIMTVASVPSVGGTNIATITEIDTYVVGQSTLSTTITVKAGATNTGPITGQLYHAGDCYLADHDSGYGAYVAQSGSVQCTATPNNTPAAREMDLTPSGSPSASYVEGNFGAVYGGITSAATPFNGSVDGSISTDNGMGLAWPVNLAPGASQAYQFATQITPNVAPTSTTTAGPCTESGIIPISTSEPNGPGQLNYTLDTLAAPAAAVTSDQQTTNVNVGSTAATHTLVYWAQDATGEQESPQHTLTVTVEPTGPSVSITSDQGDTSYELGATATVSIVAQGVNLSSNPSAQHVPISTTTAGTFAVTRTATDACGTSSATYTYTVLPPPVLGMTVDAEPVSGVVFVKLPSSTHGVLDAPLGSAVEALSKGSGFVALTQARGIPVGSIVDTTAGVASLTSATNKKNQMNKGNFGAGLFQVLQNRKQKGLTQLHLMDTVNASKVCASVGLTHSREAQIAGGKKLSSTVLVQLKGTAHGGFQTVGKYSAATVRGTTWSVENRCDGTFTKVTRGEVTVHDFRRRKTITLTTGRSYLALAPILPPPKAKPKPKKKG